MPDGPGWAVVTGASSGIGARFVRELGRRGHPVLAVARRLDRLQQVAAQSEGRVETHVADLSTPAGVSSVVERAQALGDLELLVNNAGVGSLGRFLDLPLEAQLAAMRLNMDAVVTLAYRLLPLIRKRGRGGIINIASAMSFQPVPYFATYAAAKAFVLHFSEALAEELRGTNVRVLAVCPGFVKTEFESAARESGLNYPVPPLTPERVVSTALASYDRGAKVSVVGLINSMLAMSGRLMPRWMTCRVVGALMKPISKV